MELDKRIIDGKKYLDCFDTDIATEFVGEKCYFGEDVTDFEDISKLTCTMLYSIDNSNAPYSYYKDGICYSTGFILPCIWVKETKKEYRPYTLNEFTEEFSLGDEIIVKRKDDGKIRHKLFIEYTEDEEEDIRLGSFFFSFEELFNKYELYTDEGWKPFGVEE